MPIRSQQQWKYFEEFHKKLLDKWQKESPVTYQNLPKRVSKPKTNAKTNPN